MEQEVKYIDIKDLVLWTENPRDPIDKNATDQNIVDRALESSSSKWNLPKLAKAMGDYYDFSELPTVVYHDERPVVYDGNRRIILAKIKYGLVTVPDGAIIESPDFPEKIPCNICSEEVALRNILRKHGDTGSWQPLEREVFLHKFMGAEKSPFLILEEATNIISKNSHLNKRFVKDEIFTKDTLKTLGFTFRNGELHTRHSNEEAVLILSDISEKIRDKKINTRNNRGKIIEVLEPPSQQLIGQNKNNKSHIFKTQSSPQKNVKKQQRQSKRTIKTDTKLFGGDLYLRIGDVSNLYRDIIDLYKFYLSKKDNLSETFPRLIRMSLRLLCETAAKEDNNKNLKKYLEKYFTAAKNKLDQDKKTTLLTHNVTEKRIVMLLHIGAHNYRASNNIEQTIAMSIIIGLILMLSHGKTK